MTEIYVINISQLRDNKVYEKALNYLSNDRHKKLEALKRRDDKLRCVAAGYLLHRALASYGIDAVRAEYRCGEHGKPYIVSDGNIFFSLSHSGEMAMCAVSDVCDVGCDIEYNVNLKIAQRFFAPSEIEILNSSRSPEDTFLRIWTLKESFIKLSGKGLSIPLSSFVIALGSPSCCPSYPNLNFSEFEFSQGYRGAVCTEDKISKIVHLLNFE